MAYSKSMPEAKRLREKFAHVSTVGEIQAIAEENILQSGSVGEAASFHPPRKLTASPTPHEY
jgi:hypothetical protein